MKLSVLIFVFAVLAPACSGQSDPAATAEAEPPADEGASAASQEPPGPSGPADEPATAHGHGGAEQGGEVPLVDIPNAARYQGILVGGHPSPEQLRQASQVGYQTIVNLRTPSEPGVDQERELANELGLTYVSIPVDGAEDVTEDKARALHEALSETPGPTIVHCRSGNRVGALFALREHHVEDAEPEAALEAGRAAGLTKLEPTVREHLGLSEEAETAGDRDE